MKRHTETASVKLTPAQAAALDAYAEKKQKTRSEILRDYVAKLARQQSGTGSAQQPAMAGGGYANP